MKCIAMGTQPGDWDIWLRFDVMVRHKAGPWGSACACNISMESLAAPLTCSADTVRLQAGAGCASVCRFGLEVAQRQLRCPVFTAHLLCTEAAHKTGVCGHYRGWLVLFSQQFSVSALPQSLSGGASAACCNASSLVACRLTSSS